MNMRVQALLANKHTTGAALFYAVCELVSIWFPEYKVQLGATQQWALVYGLLLAGDSRPINGEHEQNEKDKSGTDGVGGTSGDKPAEPPTSV